MKLLRPAVAAMLAALCAIAGAQHMHEHRFSDAERWAKIFDDPARDAWQKPQEVIAALAVTPDSTVADIGSGTGYFAVRLARAAPKGRVYGIDTEPSMVKYLDERAKHEGLANLVSIAGRPGDASLPGKVDLVLLVDVYHHIGERESYFGRLRGSLNPGARVAIIDFRLESPSGPPKRERIGAEQVKGELAKAGFAVAKEHGFLPNQYFLVFEAKQ
ncbi:MAG TPA: class I SAM-dependent methyltransferase [Burkholderiales bacterium]|nr:class I SAM-dependent methyltransferase [Burkholderiales bacterium]